MRKGILICVSVALMFVPAYCMGDRSDAVRSSDWSARVHEENSIIASVLYIPYIFGQLPFRIVDGIFNSKPTSRATVPPPAHLDSR